MLSCLVPRVLRDDFAAVYAFCRVADDLADEQGVGTEARERALAGLADWRRQLDACFREEASSSVPANPVFVALRATAERRGLDPAPFHHLIDAFEQDQRVSRYGTWDELIGYCRGSADPVGRIVLKLFGADFGVEPTDDDLRRSDAICTALQLTNFWQDVRRDLFERDRVYLPADALAAVGLDESVLRTWARETESAERQEAFAAALSPLLVRTRALFYEGQGLLDRLPPAPRRVIGLFRAGGLRVLARVEASEGGTLWRRPRLTRGDRAALLARAVLRIGASRHGRAAVDG